MPEKQIIAHASDASCGFGMAPDVLFDDGRSPAERPKTFHALATIVHGYKNVEGKRLTVHYSPETFERLIRSYVQMFARKDLDNPAWTHNDYVSAKAGAARLREMAEDLDVEAEAMPAWRKPRPTQQITVTEAFAEAQAALAEAVDRRLTRLDVVREGPVDGPLHVLTDAEGRVRVHDPVADNYAWAALAWDGEEKADEPTYKIVRFYQEGSSEVIDTGLSLDEAQVHCRREDTRGDGWFDGYEQEA